MLFESLVAGYLALVQPAVAKDTKVVTTKVVAQADTKKAETKAETKTETKAAKDMTADELVTQVQAYYESVEKFKANFRQEYTNTTFGTTKTHDGKVMLGRGGKMRWDYEKPEKKYFISDGTTLWVYEEEAKQAFKKDLADEILPTAVSFLYGEGDLAKEFTAALDPGAYGGKKDIVLKLTPKESSPNYKNLWLVVDPSDFRVKESVILETTDNINHFFFTKVKINAKAKFSDKHFKFKPPKDVKVIEPEAKTDGKSE